MASLLHSICSSIELGCILAQRLIDSPSDLLGNVEIIQLWVLPTDQKNHRHK
jgi:hypothetical protein